MIGRGGPGHSGFSLGGAVADGTGRGGPGRDGPTLIGGPCESSASGLSLVFFVSFCFENR